MHVMACLLLLCLGLATPARADLAAGQLALQRADFAKAIQELGPPAQQGDREAQYLLGTLLEHGLGQAEDFAAGRRWMELAGRQGHVRAQLYLAFVNHYGRNAKVDLAQAGFWYSLAQLCGEEAQAEKARIGLELVLPGLSAAEVERVKAQVEAVRPALRACARN